MKNQEDTRRLFKEDKQVYYDFSLGPSLIRARNRAALGARIFGEQNMSRWMKSQQLFLDWTRDRRVFTRQYVQDNKAAYDGFFRKRGGLRGKILDIGGGWGLFRQWWEARESDLFVVHDPGVERFLRGPHKVHRYFYERAFSLPMIFVEGFGEDLPYRDGIFDICLCAASLDHCVDPQRVIDEGYRCTKQGGFMIVIQSCSSEPNERLPLWKNTRKHSPSDLLRILYGRIFHPETGHLRQFAATDVKLLLRRAGFPNISVDAVSTLGKVYAFEAQKPP